MQVPVVTPAEQALRRLQALNRFVFELNQIGRRAGLHNRIPWRERLERLPPDAVPLTAEEIAARGWHVGNVAPAAEVQETAPPYGKRPRAGGRRKAPRAK
jgi:hypothetical protein